MSNTKHLQTDIFFEVLRPSDSKYFCLQLGLRCHILNAESLLFFDQDTTNPTDVLSLGPGEKIRACSFLELDNSNSIECDLATDQKIYNILLKNENDRLMIESFTVVIEPINDIFCESLRPEHFIMKSNNKYYCYRSGVMELFQPFNRDDLVTVIQQEDLAIGITETEYIIVCIDGDYKLIIVDAETIDLETIVVDRTASSVRRFVSNVQTMKIEMLDFRMGTVRTIPGSEHLRLSDIVFRNHFYYNPDYYSDAESHQMPLSSTRPKAVEPHTLCYFDSNRSELLTVDKKPTGIKVLTAPIINIFDDNKTLTGSITPESQSKVVFNGEIFYGLLTDRNTGKKIFNGRYNVIHRVDKSVTTSISWPLIVMLDSNNDVKFAIYNAVTGIIDSIEPLSKINHIDHDLIEPVPERKITIREHVMTVTMYENPLSSLIYGIMNQIENIHIREHVAGRNIVIDRCSISLQNSFHRTIAGGLGVTKDIYLRAFREFENIHLDKMGLGTCFKPAFVKSFNDEESDENGNLFLTKEELTLFGELMYHWIYSYRTPLPFRMPLNFYTCLLQRCFDQGRSSSLTDLELHYFMRVFHPKRYAEIEATDPDTAGFDDRREMYNHYVGYNHDPNVKNICSTMIDRNLCRYLFTRTPTLPTIDYVFSGPYTLNPDNFNLSFKKGDDVTLITSLEDCEQKFRCVLRTLSQEELEMFCENICSESRPNTTAFRITITSEADRGRRALRDEKHIHFSACFKIVEIDQQLLWGDEEILKSLLTQRDVYMSH